jgi:hypothetical protein
MMTSRGQIAKTGKAILKYFACRRLFFNLGDRNQMLERHGEGYIEFI